MCFAGIRTKESFAFRISPATYRTIILTALNAILIVDSSWWAGYWAHPWFSNYCSSPLSPYNSKSRACSRCRQVVNLGVWSQRCSGLLPPMLVAPGGEALGWILSNPSATWMCGKDPLLGLGDCTQLSVHLWCSLPGSCGRAGSRALPVFSTMLHLQWWFMM